MNETIWQILKIEKTVDRKLIRRAYARESKNCHPEEKPEEFRRLYDAYQQALDYAGTAENPAGEPDGKDASEKISAECMTEWMNEKSTQEDSCEEKERILSLFRSREEEQKYRLR